MSEQHPSGPHPGPVPRPDPRPDPRALSLSLPGPGQPVPGGPVGPLPAVPPSGYPNRYPAPRPDPLPAPGTEYAQFLRTGRNRWWKGLVVIVLLVVGYVVVSFVTGLGAIGLDLATGRIDQESLLQGRVTITPALLLSINLSAAIMIPLSMLLQWGFYGQPVRWIHSVRGHLRWDLLGRVALIIVPIWVVYVALSIFVFPAPPSGAFTAESVALLAVVLLTTPLQAAGEEYGARGLITRAAGSWSADARLSLVISTVVSAVIFTLAHGAADFWLIALLLPVRGLDVGRRLAHRRLGGCGPHPHRQQRVPVRGGHRLRSGSRRRFGPQRGDGRHVHVDPDVAAGDHRGRAVEVVGPKRRRSDVRLGAGGAGESGGRRTARGRRCRRPPRGSTNRPSGNDQGTKSRNNRAPGPPWPATAG